MENRLISIRTGAGAIGRGDRRCKRGDCVFPRPLIRFDLEGHRVVAVWSWLGVGIADVPNGIKINVMPTMLLIPMSYN
jgi:hypothetical protein